MAAGKAMAKGRGLISATQFNILVLDAGVSNAMGKANPVGA
ncbi:hypothetical protein [Polynucleobacter corsicus]|nr:hypothetical protein [Polynucleobacter corsicus]